MLSKPESPMLSTSLEDRFAHRENKDGTFESICRQCFITVAVAGSAADLKRPEADHLCDSWMLRRFRPKHSGNSQEG